MSGPARYTALGRNRVLRSSAEPVMPDRALSRCVHWLDAPDKTIAHERQLEAHGGPVGAA
jgi:hypothetical protein